MTRVGIIWAAMVAGSLLVLRRRAVARQVGGFLTESDSPLNLAILRIATFGTLLLIPAGREEFIIHAGLPDALLFPPSGLGTILASTLPDANTARLLLFAWMYFSYLPGRSGRKYTSTFRWVAPSAGMLSARSICCRPSAKKTTPTS